MAKGSSRSNSKNDSGRARPMSPRAGVKSNRNRYGCGGNIKK